MDSSGEKVDAGGMALPRFRQYCRRLVGLCRIRLGRFLGIAAAYLEEAKKTDKANLPFHGYYYRILTGQGPHPPGGEYKYVINGNMIAGFALIAYPADYGSSGIMTFLVSHQGKVHEKDLGKETHEIAKAMAQYDPDATWVLAEDEQ